MALTMKVKDPICGMVIESASAAAHGTYGTETVYFCSTSCQKSYEKQSARRPA
ncbi:MAG TPA: YHS domain-containing protein [Thermoplasmata archaeon]|nr:YHS domain-containing protein [Thermoplasmata archaeon]